ncbi:hypothetical protein DHEL01_v208905 [Diaporthe helianthi]|uniref:C2H2-type domain-containing protein n=1 Tax=Diaporthe helianthi TaxID=158607 RepID=A0A2P5HR08_DIAHE|nr:hypothetical protein DHEL01_v208905 [Diaporthe helianthi]
MGRACMDQARGDTHSPDPISRARPGSRDSTTTQGLFQGLHIIDTPPAPTHTSHLEPTRTTKTPGPGTPRSTYINTLSSSQTSSSYPPSPASQPQASPFPPLPEHIPPQLAWIITPSRPHLDGTPSLRVNPASEYSFHSPLAPQPSPQPASSDTMSTAALHFDPGFNHFSMGSRSSFAWPGMCRPYTIGPPPRPAHQGHPSNLAADVVLEPTNGGLLPQDMGHYAPESSLSPPMHSRSATSSPPRMSAEQRELKRQREQARRDSKLSARIQRAGSQGSQSGYDVASPPSTQGEFAHTSGMSSMPVYTTAPADISLLTEPTTLAPQMVLPSYSPPLPSSNQMGFPSPYQQPQYIDYPYPSSTGAPLSSHYGPVSHDPVMMYSIPPMMQAGGAPHQHDNQGHVRVVQSRPKPQCWEHGCNGRQFSTFSNLLRHQREKSGQATKASCPDCGAEFTRTTARNGHLLHQKCKQKRQSSTSSS